VLESEIARLRGDLFNENLLGQLAFQFGQATGRGGALRDMIGSVDRETGRWRAKTPDPRLLERTAAPHARGAILVSAIFGAFLRIYRRRTADLYRIASDGTGILREGAIHPDLVRRLAHEAEKSARHVLQMCIRAVDYCPPVDITFGDYLRALITGDVELNPDDSRDYRTAFIESFRAWGIHPEGLRSVSAEALLWPTGEDAFGKHPGLAEKIRVILASDVLPNNDDASRRRRSRADRLEPWHLDSDRLAVANGEQRNARLLWQLFIGAPTLSNEERGQMLAAIGLASVANGALRDTVRHSLVERYVRTPGKQKATRTAERVVATEVHSVRTALRRKANGRTITDLVVEITQQRRGFIAPADQAAKDGEPVVAAAELERLLAADAGVDFKTAKGDYWQKERAAWEAADFKFRRGCTLIIDPETGDIRRVIPTRGSVAADAELDRVRRFITGGDLEPKNAFAGPLATFRDRNPFALLHAHEED
jgi:hypothetical protein